MTDPVVEALTALREKVAALDAESQRLRQAIAALEALGGHSSEVPRSSSHDRNRPSVRTMAIELMEEKDRDWSAGEILAEYDQRGTPVHGQDPNNALRAALADALKRGLVVRTEVGRYKSVKWTEQPAQERPAGPRRIPPGHEDSVFHPPENKELPTST